MNWTLEIAPFLPPAAMSVVGLLCLLVAGAVIWRAPASGIIRALAIGLLFLTLLNPLLRQEERESLSNIALVVVDHSDSQKITRRFEQTLNLERRLRKKLGTLKNLEIRTIESHSRDEAGRHGTALITDLHKGLADIPSERLAGVFLLTDGEIHDLPKDPESLRLDVPVHALVTGRPDEFDRHIKVIEAPRFGIVEQTRQVRLKIMETGLGAKKRAAQKQPPTTDKDAEPKDSMARLTIRFEGRRPRSRYVRIGEEVEIDFDFPHAGQNILEIELEAAPNELTTANNRLVLTAQGVRESLRVLLVSGEPHPGERTWRNLLRSDAAVDLVHFTILRPPSKQDGTPISELSLIAFPTRELFSEKLNEFDLIIFDRYHRRGVLPLIYLDNIANYVEQGGAVLIAAGTQFAKRQSLAHTPLSHVLPAYPTGSITAKAFRPRTTKDGTRHPVTRALPGGNPERPSWGSWFRTIDAQAQSGDVLMTGPDKKPLLVLDRRGRGRVAMLLSDHAWLWARGYQGGGPYSALFRRLSHWLMKEPDLEEEFLTASAKGRTLTLERRSMQDQVPPVTLISPTGEKSRHMLKKVSAGVWRKTVKAETGGLYRLASGELKTAIHVGRINAVELSKVTATLDKVKTLARATKGSAAFAGDAKTPLPRLLMSKKGSAMHGPGWLALIDQKASRVTSSRQISLFTGLLALAALLAALSLTWLREGRWN